MIWGRILPWAIGCWLLIFVGAVGWDRMPFVGPHAKIVGLRDDLTDSRAAEKRSADLATSWEKSFRASEAARTHEQEQANAAVAQDAQACDARVAQARRSSAAIRTITRVEPPHDSQGCPVRQLVPSDRLRDALQPPAR